MKIIVTDPNHEYLEQYGTYKVFNMSENNFVIKLGEGGKDSIYCDVCFTHSVMVNFEKHFHKACKSYRSSMFKNALEKYGYLKNILKID